MKFQKEYYLNMEGEKSSHILIPILFKISIIIRLMIKIIIDSDLPAIEEQWVENY